MPHAVPVLFESISLVILLLILAFDMFLAYRRPHVPSAKEASSWVIVYVALAVFFFLCMLVFAGAEPAGEFLAGWLTEYSLSIDNLFVFVLIMARFQVPRKYQQQVLMVGIIIALVLRGVFILLGAQLIAAFGWIFYLFGAFLLYTALQQAFGKADEDSGDDNRFIGFVRHHLRISDTFDGSKLRTTLDARRVFTPMLIIFLAIGSTDLLFALDSIPAIFGITTSAFIVFAANIFALMGLRQLYFLLGHLLKRLEYLKYGIAVILFFIGVKLVFHAMHDNHVPFINNGQPISWAPEISTWVSLAVIIVTMVVAATASLIRIRMLRGRETGQIERE